MPFLICLGFQMCCGMRKDNLPSTPLIYSVPPEKVVGSWGGGVSYLETHPITHWSIYFVLCFESFFRNTSNEK